MTTLHHSVLSRAGLPSLALSAALVSAALPGSAMAAATTTGPAVDNRPTASPTEPEPRKGDYVILEQGTYAAIVKCTEGGTIFVETSDLTGKDTHGRDAALRSACQSVDYSK